jgi:hypothetical protein
VVAAGSAGAAGACAAGGGAAQAANAAMMADNPIALVKKNRLLVTIFKPPNS